MITMLIRNLGESVLYLNDLRQFTTAAPPQRPADIVTAMQGLQRGAGPAVAQMNRDGINPYMDF